jgi:hypothetical protein
VCRPIRAVARSIALGVQSGANTKQINGTSSSASMIRLKPITARKVSGVE